MLPWGALPLPSTANWKNSSPLLLHFRRNAWSREQPGGEISREFIGSDRKAADWKGVRWLNSPLFCGLSFVPGCTVTLMLSLSFQPHTAPSVPHTKEYDALPEDLNGLSIYFLKEWDSPFDSPHLVKNWVPLIIKVHHHSKILSNVFKNNWLS